MFTHTQEMNQMSVSLLATPLFSYLFWSGVKYCSKNLRNTYINVADENKDVYTTLCKKWSFQLRISSVSVTKSAGN